MCKRKELLIIIAIFSLFLLPYPIYAPSAGAVNEGDLITSFEIFSDVTPPNVTSVFPTTNQIITTSNIDWQHKINMTIVLNEPGHCRLTTNESDTYSTSSITMNETNTSSFYYYLDEVLHTGWYNYYARCIDLAGNSVNYTMTFFADITEGSTGAGGSMSGSDSLDTTLKITISPEDYHIFDMNTEDFSVYVTSEYGATCKYSLDDTQFTNKASIWDTMTLFSYNNDKDHKTTLTNVSPKTDIFILCKSYDEKWSNYEHRTYYLNEKTRHKSVWDWWVSQIGGVFLPQKAQEFTVVFTLFLVIMSFGFYDVMQKDKKIKKKRKEEIENGS